MDDRSSYIYTPTSPSWARSPTSPTTYGASPTSPIAPAWSSVTSPTTPHFASPSSRLPFDYSSSSSSTSYPSLPGASFNSVPPSASSGFPSFSTFPAPSPPPLDSQKEPSSGPNRALTRRQRAALQNRVGAPSTRPATSRPVFRTPAAASSSSQPQASTSHQGQQQQSQTPTPSDSSSSLRSASPASPALSASSSLTSVSSASPLLPPSSPFPSSAQFATPQGQFATPLNLSRTKSRKQRLFNIDRKEICKYAAENPNSRQEDIAMRFGVERSTISKILKNKSRWLNVPSDEEMRIAKHRPSKFPEIEEELVLWLVSMQEQADNQPSDPTLPYSGQGRIQLTDQLIRTQARSVARRLGVPEDKFKASSGWVENFKHRHGIRGGVWRGDGKNARGARALGKGGFPPPEVQLTPTHHSDSSQVDSAFDAQSHTPIDLQPSSLSLSTDSSSSSFGSSYAGHTTNYVSAQSAYPSFSPQDTYSGNPYPASHYTEPAYPQPAPGADIPSHAEAEASLNRLLAYLDTAGQNIVTDEERTALDRVKRAMFQAASGIPYTRSSSGSM